jgi:hypothetical protein
LVDVGTLFCGSKGRLDAVTTNLSLNRKFLTPIGRLSGRELLAVPWEELSCGYREVETLIRSLTAENSSGFPDRVSLTALFRAHHPRHLTKGAPSLSARRSAHHEQGNSRSFERTDPVCQLEVAIAQYERG